MYTCTFVPRTVMQKIMTQSRRLSCFPPARDLKITLGPLDRSSALSYARPQITPYVYLTFRRLCQPNRDGVTVIEWFWLVIEMWKFLPNQLQICILSKLISEVLRSTQGHNEKNTQVSIPTVPVVSVYEQFQTEGERGRILSESSSVFCCRIWAHLWVYSCPEWMYESLELGLSAESRPGNPA